MGFLNYIYDISHPMGPGLLLAVYFFYTGISEGIFLISSLGVVFGIKRFKPLALLGAITATIFLGIAMVHLLFDLEHPLRFLNLFLNFNPKSAISWGTYLAVLYGLVLLAYTWFLIRGDEKKAKFYGTLGIPLSLSVIGYTGFVLAAVGSRPLWNSSLVPFIFLISAVVSGTALLILVISLVARLSRIEQEVKQTTEPILGQILKWSLILDVLLLAVHVLVLANSGAGGSAAAALLFSEVHRFGFLGIEVFLGIISPVVILTLAKSSNGRILAALLSLVGVMAMRFNFVVGGQQLPMSGDSLVPYHAGSWEYTLIILLAGATITLMYLALRLLLINKNALESDVNKHYVAK